MKRGIGINSLIAFTISVANAAEPAKQTPDVVKVLTWEELVPADYGLGDIYGKFQKRATNLGDTGPEVEKLQQEMLAAWANAPVVKTLDGMTVKLSGYVVPFEGDSERVDEFLLVPSYGMCIHVPPPPSNQTVYVLAPKGTRIRSLLEPARVTGVLHTKTRANELANAGYTLTATKVEDY